MQVTKEQKERANQVDLVDYLTSKGFEIMQYGNGYKIKVTNKFAGDMSSVSIFANRKGWKRWSNGEHGGDAISFLEKNMGMSFQDAVLELIGGSNLVQSSSSTQINPHTSKKAETDKKLVLPPKFEGKYSRCIAYLNQTRMIDTNIINQMIAERKIYQDNRNNAVFVGYDEKNEAKFACVRGTNTFLEKPFKRDCDGSDKRYAFSIEGANKNKLYVFEAPIDLLSHATLANKCTNNPEAWKIHSRVCLAGTADTALEHYLKTHHDVTEIHFCLDNDEAGQKAALQHCEKYSAMGFKTVNHVLKNKDMNEELIDYINKKFSNQTQRQTFSIKK